VYQADAVFVAVSVEYPPAGVAARKIRDASVSPPTLSSGSVVDSNPTVTSLPFVVPVATVK